MPFDYIEFEEAAKRDGLRMVVVPGVPSPWSEAAKGIFHVKNIPWAAVRLDPGNDALVEWAGEKSAPVAVYNDEAPRSRWTDILFLAERIAPSPSLIPENAGDRAAMFGLAHEICGEMGLAWCRRNAGVHEGLNDRPGFPKPIAEYLGPKYGYRFEEGDRYGPRVCDVLGMIASRLNSQKSKGGASISGIRSRRSISTARPL